MKKAIMFLACVVAITSLSSCKKDYACKCTTTTNGVAAASVTGGTFKETKKGAEDACGTSEISVGTTTVSCEAVKQ